MYVDLQNSRSGEMKRIKVGFSWVLLFFSGFLGLPLFLRRLYVWGGVFLALWIVNFIGPSIAGADEDAVMIQVVMFLIMLGLSIWLAIKGNEMTAKNLLEQGWEFSESDSDATKFAKHRWGLR